MSGLDDIRILNRMVYHYMTCERQSCEDCEAISQIMQKIDGVLGYYSNELSKKFR